MELFNYIVLLLMAIVHFVLAFDPVQESTIPAEVGINQALKNGFNRESKNIQEAVEDVGRVGGGKAAIPSHYPFQARVTVLNFYGNQIVSAFCGGSLVTDTRVVTAAHCFNQDAQKGRRVIVTLGTNELIVESKNFTVHPNYVASKLGNDIAVIYLPYPVELTNTIMPIKLPYLMETFEGEVATITGFGLTSDGKRSETLQEGRVRVISHSACLEYVHGMTRILPSMICTLPDFGQSTCKGDSGGPLIVYRNGGYTLIGVTSFGIGKACPRTNPNIYTRITSFMGFLRQHGVV